MSPELPSPELPSAELLDVIALLEQRCDNARHMEQHSAEFADYAADRRRQLEVVIDELRAGRHHGAAGVRASFDVAQDEREKM